MSLEKSKSFEKVTICRKSRIPIEKSQPFEKVTTHRKSFNSLKISQPFNVKRCLSAFNIIYTPSIPIYGTYFPF